MGICLCKYSLVTGHREIKLVLIRKLPPLEVPLSGAGYWWRNVLHSLTSCEH